jgi:hypothetical protein
MRGVARTTGTSTASAGAVSRRTAGARPGQLVDLRRQGGARPRRRCDPVAARPRRADDAVAQQPAPQSPSTLMSLRVVRRWTPRRRPSGTPSRQCCRRKHPNVDVVGYGEVGGGRSTAGAARRRRRLPWRCRSSAPISAKAEVERPLDAALVEHGLATPAASPPRSSRSCGSRCLNTSTATVMLRRSAAGRRIETRSYQRCCEARRPTCRQGGAGRTRRYRCRDASPFPNLAAGGLMFAVAHHRAGVIALALVSTSCVGTRTTSDSHHGRSHERSVDVWSSRPRALRPSCRPPPPILATFPSPAAAALFSVWTRAVVPAPARESRRRQNSTLPFGLASAGRQEPRGRRQLRCRQLLLRQRPGGGRRACTGPRWVVDRHDHSASSESRSADIWSDDHHDAVGDDRSVSACSSLPAERWARAVTLATLTHGPPWHGVRQLDLPDRPSS